ncbi:MAG: DNA recombination protein RmuC, partial [Patescibacteria group bacterium]|nr:DNA recombination protein RmuC [Patescibacteria group bacterium]
MNLLLIFMFGAVLVLMGLIVYLLINKKNDNSAEMASLLKQDLQGLQHIISQSQSSMNERIDKNSIAMQETVQRQMSESSRLITDVTERLAKLDETNKRVVDVADELKTLQNVLQNPKQRGVLGEYYLQTVLDNVLPAER